MMKASARRIVAMAAVPRGSVMLEALVSIVVTSLAMLASASLAVNAAKVNQTGRYRAQAVMLVNDVAERIGANQAAAAAGNYTLSAGTGGSDAQAPNCRANACTAAQQAQADLASWRNEVQAGLPQATAQVAFTAAVGATPARYTITLGWVERSVGHGGAARATEGSATAESFGYTATIVLPPR